MAIVPAVEIDGEIAASTQIRARLRAGDLAGARRMLGRPWDVDGVVVHGAERGRALGYPTANIGLGEILRPAFGVYAVRAAPGSVALLESVRAQAAPVILGLSVWLLKKQEQ